jgi:hypothetical protein
MKPRTGSELLAHFGLYRRELFWRDFRQCLIRLITPTLTSSNDNKNEHRVRKMQNDMKKCQKKEMAFDATFDARQAAQESREAFGASLLRDMRLVGRAERPARYRR